MCPRGPLELVGLGPRVCATVSWLNETWLGFRWLEPLADPKAHTAARKRGPGFHRCHALRALARLQPIAIFLPGSLPTGPQLTTSWHVNAPGRHGPHKLTYVTEASVNAGQIHVEVTLAPILQWNRKGVVIQ